MRTRTLLIGTVLLVAACSNKPSPPPITTGTGSSVRIQSDSYYSGAFTPTTLTTTVGTTVTWTNADAETHSSVSDTGLWRADNIPQSGTFSFTFAATGSFPYKCTIHPGMSGTIVVQ